MFSPYQGRCSGCLALLPSPGWHPHPPCEWITNTSPWYLQEPGLMHLDGTASGLVPSLWSSCVYLANHTIYLLLLSNGSMKHFKNTLDLQKNVVFMTMYVFVDALQAEPDQCSLSAPMVHSTECWFLPGRSSIFQCVTIQYVVPQCCREHPDAVGQEIILVQQCQVGTQSKTRVEGVTSGFLLPRDRGSAVFRVGLTFPHRAGWWWLANPPEKILLNSKLRLCC